MELRRIRLNGKEGRLYRREARYLSKSHLLATDALTTTTGILDRRHRPLQIPMSAGCASRTMSTFHSISMCSKRRILSPRFADDRPLTFCGGECPGKKGEESVEGNCSASSCPQRLLYLWCPLAQVINVTLPSVSSSPGGKIARERRHPRGCLGELPPT